MTIDRKESLSHVAPLVLHPIILRGKYGNKTDIYSYGNKMDMKIRWISRDTCDRMDRTLRLVWKGGLELQDY